MAGPGRPAHNAHPQSCSGEPIPPDEVVKRERDKKEKKLRKQLERQAKRLQQSKQKPGVNTATLIEAIQQTISEIRIINHRTQQPEELFGKELYSLLVDALGLDVCTEMLKRINSMSSHHQTIRSSSPMNFTNFNAAAAAAAAVAVAAAANLNVSNGLVNKTTSIDSFGPGIDKDRQLSESKSANPFSIDNLLSSRHVSGSLFSAAAAAAAAAAASITQPVGFLVNHSKSSNQQIAITNNDKELDYELEEMHSDNEDVSSNCSFRSNASDINVSLSPEQKKILLEEQDLCLSRKISSICKPVDECNPTDLSLIKDKDEIDCEITQVYSPLSRPRSPRQMQMHTNANFSKLSQQSSDCSSECSDPME